MKLVLNTPFSDAFTKHIQTQIAQVGWANGDEKSPLGEYICLMIANGKDEEQIAAELSTDLVSPVPGGATPASFAHWVFAELARLSGGEEEDQNAKADDNTSHGNEDAEMMDMGEQPTEEGVPTAPKAMRQSNPRRMMSQINKSMERKLDDPLHRVRPNQEKFKNQLHPKGPGGTRLNGFRHNNGLMHNGGHMNPRGGMHQNRMNGGRPFNNPNPSMLANLTPQQQLAFYQMYQQQSQVIAPFANGPGPVNVPQFPHGQMGGPQHRNHNHNHTHNRNIPPMRMNEDAYSNNFSQPQRIGGGPGGGGPSGSGSLFERIQSPPDLSIAGATGVDDGADESTKSDKLEEVPCKFGTGCTKVECVFGHPTPAQLGGKTTHYVSGEKCPYGNLCKNRKCTGSHPSPASVPNFHQRPKQIEQDCKYFPNCTNPVCPFKHPAMPMCRNGANCVRPDCHFTHNETACKFKPCLNPVCIYKHEEGQQQAPAPGENPFGNKVWTAKRHAEHVSERKFVVGDDYTEELIIPGGGDHEDVAPLDAE